MCSGPSRTTASAEYITADGGRLQNLGERQVATLSDAGANLNVKFQVTTVDQPLVAVSALVAAGHNVVFDKAGGTVINTIAGRRTPFVRRNGVYIMPFWVKSLSQCSGNDRQ